MAGWLFHRRLAFLKAEVSQRACRRSSSGQIVLLGESGLVYAIVDVVVGPIVHAFDVLAEVLGEQVDSLIFLRQDVIKFCVEHANDVARLFEFTLSALLRP